MAKSIGSLVVKISADNTELKAALKSTKRSLKEAEDALKGGSASAKEFQRKSKVAFLAVAASAALAARAITKYTDTFTGMTNKLKLATKSTEDLAFVTSEMFRIANETGSAVDATTELYAKMERATRDLGVDQARLLKITSSINKAFAISGATTQEASGAIRQLGQALSAGALRGDEFNSIAEQAPIIMEALKKETGLAAGALRDFAAEGKISAELVINALERYSDVIDGDFSTSQRTFAQKMEISKNNAIQFVGASDSAKGAVSSLGDAAVFLSKNIDTLGNIFAVVSVVITSRYIGSLVAAKIAQNTLSLSSIRAAGAVGILKGALSFLGGGLGVALIAAAAIATFALSESKAEENTRKFNKVLKAQIEHIKGIVDADKLVKLQDSIQEKRLKLMKERAVVIDKLEAATKRLNDEQEKAAILQGSTTGLKAKKDALQTELDNINQQIKAAKLKAAAVFEQKTNIRTKGAEDDKASNEAFKNPELAKTALLQVELNKRLKLQKIHNQLAFDENATAAENARAAVEARRLEELATIAAQTEEEKIKNEERRAKVIEDVKLTAEQKSLTIAEINAQELTQQQIHETEKTEIERQAAEARKAIAKQEAAAKLSLLARNANSIINLVSALGKRSVKIQKAVALARAGIAIATGIARAQELGFPANIGEMARVAAVGVNAISSIRSSNVGSSPSVPNVSGDGGGSTPAAQSQQPQQAPDRNISINMTGSGLFSADQVRELIEQINNQVGDGVELSTGG